MYISKGGKQPSKNINHLEEYKMKNEKYLIQKYSKHFSTEMGNFDFNYEEITFEIMQDFNQYKMNAFNDGEENVIIFYKEEA